MPSARLGFLYTQGRVSERKPLFASLISTTPTMNLIPIIYMAHSPFSLLIFLFHLLSLINCLRLLGEILEYAIFDPLEQIHIQHLPPTWHCTEGLIGRHTKEELVWEATFAKRKKALNLGLTLCPKDLLI